MKNIHVLPTDEPSRLYLTTEKYVFEEVNSLSTDECQNKHISITNDEEIKIGDWCLCSENLIHKVIEIKSNIGIIRFQDGVTEVLKACKKIILTTDQDLIKDGIQEIPDEFLEWFVKNPSCEEVEVEKDYRGVDLFNYKIIIPKEEPKPNSFCETPEENCTMNYCDDNGCQNRKRELVEPKQETLEEFIKKQLSLGKYQDQESAIRHSIELGTKWQQDKNKYSDAIDSFITEIKTEFKDENWDYLDFIKERVLTKFKNK